MKNLNSRVGPMGLDWLVGATDPAASLRREAAFACLDRAVPWSVPHIAARPRRGRRLGSLLTMAFALAMAGLTPVQAAERPTRADPADPAAAVPAVHHRSALAGYRPHEAVRTAPWARSNAVVNEAGGWRAYAREAAASAAGPAGARQGTETAPPSDPSVRPPPVPAAPVAPSVVAPAGGHRH